MNDLLNETRKVSKYGTRNHENYNLPILKGWKYQDTINAKTINHWSQPKQEKKLGWMYGNNYGWQSIVFCLTQIDKTSIAR